MGRFGAVGVVLVAVGSWACRTQPLNEVVPPTPSNLRWVEKAPIGGAGGWTDGKSTFVDVRRSLDGGKTWSVTSTDVSPTSPLLGMWGRSTSDLLVVHGATNGIVAYRSTNGDGSQWAAVPGPSNATFTTMSGFGDGTVVIAGTRLVGGGIVAVKRPSSTEFVDTGLMLSQRPSSICGTDAGGPIFVAVNEARRGAVIKLAGVGGAQSTVFKARGELYGLWCSSSARDVYVVGGGGFAARSRDGGATWTEEATPAKKDLFSVWGASPDVLWAVGDGGAIVRRTASGWSMDTSPTTQQVQAVWGRSSSDVWAVTQSSVLHLE